MELAPTKDLDSINMLPYISTPAHPWIPSPRPRPPVALMVVLTRVLHLMSYLFPGDEDCLWQDFSVTKKRRSTRQSIIWYWIHICIISAFVLCLVGLFVPFVVLAAYIFLLLVLLRLLCAEHRRRKFLPCDKRKIRYNHMPQANNTLSLPGTEWRFLCGLLWENKTL